MIYFQLLVIVLTGLYIVPKDFKERIIPNWMNLLIFILGLIVMFMTKNYMDHLLGFAALGSILFLVAVLTKGMGLGDVKYIYSTGLLLGFKLGGYGLIFGIIIGGVVSAVLLVLKKVDKKDFIAYGPFLVAGNLLSILYQMMTI